MWRSGWSSELAMVRFRPPRRRCRCGGALRVGTSFRFPILDLLDEERCYEWLLEHLHPEGLHCPAGHARPAHEAPHTRDRAPIVE